MLPRITPVVALILWAATCICVSALDPADSDAPRYSLTRTVSIPLKLLDPTQSTPSGRDADASALLASHGAEDELPEGPNGFDVLEDGRLLVSDPLAYRVAVFDPQGKFSQSWKLDFSPDSITLIGHETVAVRDAATGQVHGFSIDGRPHSLPEDTSIRQGEVRLKSAHSAVFVPRATGPGTSQPLEISFDRSGMSLLSVELLSVDRDGNTYVALESTKGGDEVSVQKDVRKYSGSGKLIGQIIQLPLDYYIIPVDELRVRNGVVYQLDTTKSEVRINMWNTK
jgi:hypothetical protein